MTKMRRKGQEGFFLVQAAMLLAIMATSAVVLVPNMLRRTQIQRVETMAKSMLGLADAAKVYYQAAHCDAGQEPCWPEGTTQLWMTGTPIASDDRTGVSAPIIPATTHLKVPFSASLSAPAVYGFEVVDGALAVRFGSATQTNFPVDLVEMLERKLSGQADCRIENNFWLCTSARFGVPVAQDGDELQDGDDLGATVGLEDGETVLTLDGAGDETVALEDGETALTLDGAGPAEPMSGFDMQ
jgi:type II secretory pathway pseudopilin PulG